jgi:predicted ATP-grasp superfamily ATP-dependent carboligase
MRFYRKLHAPPALARAVKRAVVDHDLTLLPEQFARRHRGVTMQQAIVGRDANCAVACFQGEVLATVTMEVLRASRETGPATVMRKLQHQEIERNVRLIVRKLGLTGLYGFDFMLESSTGHAYLIEMNPRATQTCHLELGAGRSPVAALTAAASGSAERCQNVTNLDTIALFPQEWQRNPESEFLETAYQDIPWQNPALVRHCLTTNGRWSLDMQTLRGALQWVRTAVSTQTAEQQEQ